MQEILLDTSFILPSLGIDTGIEVRRGLERIQTAGQLWCSRFAITEALWTGARLAKRGDLNSQIFEQGLNSLFKGGTYMMVEEGPEVYADALELTSLGHTDMIDNLLYSTSRRLGLKLLTLDNSLRAFIESKGLENTLIFPKEL